MLLRMLFEHRQFCAAKGGSLLVPLRQVADHSPPLLYPIYVALCAPLRPLLRPSLNQAVHWLEQRSHQYGFAQSRQKLIPPCSHLPRRPLNPPVPEERGPVRKVHKRPYPCFQSPHKSPGIFHTSAVRLVNRQGQTGSRRGSPARQPSPIGHAPQRMPP